MALWHYLLPGATDLGNATSSGFPNVKLLLNYSFT